MIGSGSDKVYPELWMIIVLTDHFGKRDANEYIKLWRLFQVRRAPLWNIVPNVQREQATQLMGHKEAFPSSHQPILLRRRERQVLELVAQGARNREIAQILHIKEVTVEGYLTSIYRKLGVRSRTQAVLKAFERQLITLNPKQGQD
jgi:ATP/maltotriose-dependent transcriptional regulator MalT